MALCSQYVQLLVVLVKLKLWKLLFMLLVMVAVASNLYFYEPVDNMMLQNGEKGLHTIGAKEFQKDCVVLGDMTKHQLELDVVTQSVSRMAKADFKHNMESCSGDDNCREKYFQLLLGKRRGKLAHYIDYSPSNGGKAKLQCQLSTGNELYCPFMAYLVSVSQPQDPFPDFQYNETFVFRLMSSTATVQKTTRGDNTICKTDVNFYTVFPRTVMAQMIFVAIALVFYLLVSTVTCIHELKQNGFLQLMFRRCYSVLAYWLALWTITLLEMAIFAAVLTVAYSYQCSGFYVTSQLTSVFLSAFLQFCCVAALVFLSTVVTRSIVIVSLLACLMQLAAMTIIVANRIFLSEKNSPKWIRYLLLPVTFGHIAEQVQAILLKGIVPNDAFNGIVLPVTVGMLILLITGTIYLDFVLKSGNGLRFPHGYLFFSRFWSIRNGDRVALEEPQSSVMVEDIPEGFKPMLSVFRLNKSYKNGGHTTVALRNISAQFNQNQITAIVGHNGSGKSTLFQILSGERHATKGAATVNKLLLTDPLYRYHLGNDIGYCPQSNALVDRLTVLDTLKLTASSTGLVWDDVAMDVNEVLSTLQMNEKTNNCIGSLSSNEKRKVCVTMALVGKPKVILLDNPSRDMDYISKRRMWRLLHEYKKGRTIIFSTLFIDEADGMADRMIFLSGGSHICAGSSFFFKRAFDCKFIIQIASKTEFHVPYIIRKITARFNTIRVRSVANADLELEVPIMDDHILPAVALEVENMSELIDEFGIANYSLDDVFSKLKASSPFEIEDHFQSGTIGYVADDVDRITAIHNRPDTILSDGPAPVNLETSKLLTIVAMFLSHYHQTSRSKVRLIIRIIVPVVLLLLIIACAFLESSMKNARKKIRFDLNVAADFDRSLGACLFYTSPHNQAIHLDTLVDQDCTVILTGKNQTGQSGQDIKSIELPITRFKHGDFSQAILSKDIFTQLTKLCKKAKIPCPVIYSDEWCPDVPVIKNHKVYVGTIVDSSKYTALSVATSSIDIYKHTFRRTTIRGLITGKVKVSTNRTVDPDFDTEAIIDMRSIFFPFYGMFIQLILLAFIPSICLNDVIQDKKNGVYKQLMSMSITRFHYWLCTIVNHWIQLSIVYILSALFLLFIASPGYKNAFFLVGVFPPTLLLGLINSLLCVYVVSSVVESVSYVYIAIYFSFSLIVSMSALLIQSYDLLGQIMIYLIPQYAVIAPTFYGIKFIHYSLAFYQDTGTEPSLLPYLFHMPRMRDAIIALVVHFVLLILLLIVLENRGKVRDSCCRRAAPETEKNAYENCKEAAITEEIGKIERNPKSEDHIIEVNELKVINSDGQVLVKNLTFGLKNCEIFGLLGPCGSGKGSAVRAIVGDQRQTAGRVDFHVKDRWLSSDSAVQQGFIGYCPRYDPLYERLTVRENLQFYARAVGISLTRVQQLVRQFRLESDVNTILMHATAGVKRRLTLAIAVLTSPRFLAIHEASAGVDPEGRQILWQTIKSLAGKQRSMLVATQEMEEAETLCGRICILNSGMMAALNNIDELISRYRKLYFVEVQIKDAADETQEEAERRKGEIVDIVLDRFYGSIVIEKLTWRFQFAIPIKSIGCLSTALKWLVDMKKKLNILYFTIHYATIDQTMKAIVVHHETEMLKQEDEAADVTV